MNLVVDGLVGNGIVVGRTDISLNASKNLVINDLSNEADHLTIQSDTTLNRFVISDPGKVLSDSTGLGTLLDSHTLAIPFSAVTGTSILVNSAGGTDSLSLDFSKGNFSKQVNYDGGDPSTSPGDSLTLSGGGLRQRRFHCRRFDSGSINLAGNSTISYVNTEQVNSLLTAANVSYQLPTGPNSATLRDDGTIGNSLSQISGATIATLDFAYPMAALTIIRGNAGDAFTVAALPDFRAALSIGAVGNEFAAVSFAGAVALSADKNLAVTASGTISFTTNGSDISTSGHGTISLTTARNISFASGSSLTASLGTLL